MEKLLSKLKFQREELIYLMQHSNENYVVDNLSKLITEFTEVINTLERIQRN